MASNSTKALKVVESGEDVLSHNSEIDHEKWFDKNIKQYKTLAAMVAATLKSTLDGNGISYVDIPFREKGKKSFLNKIQNRKIQKEYTPKHMTDLAGIRVITLIESDIKKIGELIERLFRVHPADSGDKTKGLGENKVGYRSVHYVCDIGEQREELLEWEALKGLRFEIQVRTALMHAWAEIEHDRGYKLSGKLPSDIARRFSLLSAALESADLEFNRLTVEIEEYTKTMNKDILGNVKNEIELSSVSVKTLIHHLFPKVKFNDNEDDLSLAIDIALKFGISNIDELKKIILSTRDFYLNYMNEFEDHSDVLVTSLLFEDIYKLAEVFKEDDLFTLNGLPDWMKKAVKEKYKGENIDKIINN